MTASGGSGSSGGGSKTGTYIVPQSRPTITAIQTYSPITTGQTMRKDVAEKMGLVSWAKYDDAQRAQAKAIAKPSPIPYTYTDTSGNIHLVEDYRGQGGGKYDTVIGGFKGGYSGSGYRKQAKDIQTAQQKLKSILFQSPSAQWGSQEAYERAYRDYLRSGGMPILQPAGIIPQSTMAERQAEADMIERLQATEESLKRDMMRGSTVLPLREAATKAGEIYAPRFGKMISREEFYAKRPTPVMKAGAAFEKAEAQWARKLNIEEQAIKPLEQWYERGVKSLARMGLKSEPKTQRIAEEFTSGAAYGVAQKPLTTAGNVAFAILVTKGAGLVVSKVPALAAGLGTGRIASKINAVNVLGAGLAAAYGIDVTGRVVSAPSPYREAGKIAATEVIPFAAGGYLGMKPLPKMALPKASVKFYEINKPVSVPGMGVFYKKSLEAKLILGKPKAELTFLERRALEIQATKKAARMTPEQKIRQLETENLLFARKSAKIAAGKTEKLYLTETSIKTEIGGRQAQLQAQAQATSTYQQIAVQAQALLPKQAQAQAILGSQKQLVSQQQAQALAAYQGEAFAYPRLQIASSASKGVYRPGTALAQAENLGLKRVSKTSSILMVAGILGVKSVLAQPQKQMQRQRQALTALQVAQTKQASFVKVSGFIGAVQKSSSNLHQIASVGIESSLAQAQAVGTAQLRAPVVTATQRPALRERVIVPLKPKSFLSKVNQHKQRRGKAKFKWSVQNPVPDLESLGF